MNARIDVPTEKVDAFCKRHRIHRLALFGSVLRDDFRPDSDVDVLVEFDPHADCSLFDVAAMRDELSALIGRKVDIVETSALRNPFRRHEILRHQQVIYAA